MTQAVDSTNLGLIAAGGRLPVLVARGMRAAGKRVCAVGLAGLFDPQLPPLCDDFRTAGLVQIGRWIRLLRKFGVQEATLVGRVSKVRMHDPLRLFRQIPDWRAAVLWYRRLRHDRRSHAVLAAVADELARNGIQLIDSTMFIPDQLATPGVMGRVQPTAEQRGDIEFGWPLLLSMGRLEIGQAMAVRDRDVIAVEAVEGTDAMIDRAGGLCKARGWTLLKTARPGHDMRTDVPTIGEVTIERAARNRCRCIAIGAGHVILIDKAAVIAAADRAGVALVGVEG